MSVTEGYVLHLYCDDPQHGGQFMMEYGGDTKAAAWKRAKAFGWKVTGKPAQEGTTCPGTKETICWECMQRAKKKA